MLNEYFYDPLFLFWSTSMCDTFVQLTVGGMG
jgi:hypothetical protein